MKRIATGSVNLPRREALLALASGLMLRAAMADERGVLPASKSLAGGIRLAPTLLFIGRDGVEAAERLQGYSADFYSAYLAERLALAQTRI